MNNLAQLQRGKNMKSAISDVFDHTQKFSLMLDFFQTQQNDIFINILHLEGYYSSKMHAHKKLPPK